MPRGVAAAVEAWHRLARRLVGGDGSSGLGAVVATTISVGSELGFGPTRWLAGIEFSLGLILVVVAGAELFTGKS
jgi:formate/nitrite transporter FocA (FNT family)